jgi:hypothetical protein
LIKLALGFAAIGVALALFSVQATGTLKGDDDLDTCIDPVETGPYPNIGGQRSPFNFWDFYDVPTGSPLQRNGAVSATDFNAILLRFGATGTATSVQDALTPPPPPPAYHAAYDRTPPQMGADPWDLRPADGAISSVDFFANLAQFGHRCGTGANIAGMSLSGPTGAPNGGTITVIVSADPAPNYGVGGFATELTVDPPAGLSYVARPLCEDEIPVVQEPGADLACLRSTSPLEGFPRHGSLAGDNPPLAQGALQGPLGTLVELDFLCSEIGTYQLTLTAYPDAEFGAVYSENLDGALIEVPTFPKGGEDVADTLTVSCDPIP